jgi:two-component system KDP operon response regulator KdpE
VRPLVLVADSDRTTQRLLGRLLRDNGYRPIVESRGDATLETTSRRRPDLILLDPALPDLDGVEVTRRLREWTETPIVVVSLIDSVAAKVEALDAGADDYLTKPFSTPELLARIRVALRRSVQRPPGTEEPFFESGELRLDFERRLLTMRGEPIKLSPTEYRLLAVLTRAAGRVLTHGQILQRVWGTRSTERIHYVRVYIAMLRRKLEPDPARPQYILTEVGVGYRFASDGR